MNNIEKIKRISYKLIKYNEELNLFKIDSENFDISRKKYILKKKRMLKLLMQFRHITFFESDFSKVQLYYKTFTNLFFSHISTKI